MNPYNRFKKEQGHLSRLVLAAISFSLGCGPALPGQVCSPISGFTTLQINGHHNLSSSALSFLGIGLTRPPVYQGRLDSFGPSTISDSRAAWANGQFEGSQGPHYFEITSGPYAGFMADIVETQGGSRTLFLSCDLSSLLSGGESYRIGPHWTLSSVFDSTDEAGLGGGSLVTADEILLLNATTGVYSTYYFKTIGFGGTGWRSSASASADQSNVPIYPGQGILIRRKQSPDLSLKLFGAVKTGPTLLQVTPGLNLVATLAPGLLTLVDSGLYTGDPATGLAGGSIATADKVLLFDGTTYRTYYYKTVGLGGTGWRSDQSPSADASGSMIPAGTGFLLQRSAALPAFFWKVPGN